MTRLRTDFIRGPDLINTPHNETRNQAYTDLLDVGDRPVDLEGLADRFAGLGTHVVLLEAGKMRP